MREAEVVVVGAGPAGLSAAVAAAQAGAEVVLVDQSLRPGGQYFRQLPPGFQGNGRPDWGTDEEKGRALLDDLSRQKIEILADTVAYAMVADKTLSLAQQTSSFQLKGQRLILATGAYERPVPFPGWTLPGVFTAGALQTLVKIQRVLPGRRIMVAGSGPLLYVVAATLLDAGAELVALVEAAQVRSGWRQSPRLWRSWQPLLRGLEYLRQVRDAGAPVLFNHAVVRATGDEQVRQVTVMRVDDTWRPQPGSEQDFEVDALCVSYGFLPSAELARLAGCQVEYRPELHAYVPVHDGNMETSLPGVFVAGEVAGTGGAGIAMAQGQIAGIVAANQLGYAGEPGVARQLQAARKGLAGLERFRDAMNETFALRPGIWDLATEDTIICRCEEITKGEIRAATQEGSLSSREVKLRTWAGMGPCQGRFCTHAILQIMAEVTEVEVSEIPPPRVRPPVHTVPVLAMSDLLAD